MIVAYNKTFETLLKGYDLPKNLLFSIDIPPAILDRINGDILITERGLCLKSYNELREPKESWDNKAYSEDDRNHFHVTGYVEGEDEKSEFMLAITTLNHLALRFENEATKGVRFWLSFQTKKMGKYHAIINGLHKEGDTYYTSDRLSFYSTKTISPIPESFESPDFAILIIDI